LKGVFLFCWGDSAIREMAGKQQSFPEKYQPKKRQIAVLLLLFLPLYRIIFTETY